MATERKQMELRQSNPADVSSKSKSKELTEELLDNSFQSIQISENTDDTLYQEIKKSFLYSIAPWLQEETKLLPYEEAALLLVYAIEGREMIKIELSQRSRTCYHLRTKYHRIYRIAAWGLLLIHIFEQPVWTFRLNSDNWSDGNIYPSYQMPYLPLSASTLLQLFFISFLWIAVGLEFGYKQNTKNWNYTVFFMFVLGIQTLSLFTSLIYAIASSSIVISASPLSCLNILLVEYKLQNHLSYVLRTIPRFFVLLVSLGAMIVLYTSFAYFFFEPGTTEFLETFPDFGTGVWNMLMIFNGSNWPSPMIPAFHKNRLYCTYFFFYIILFNWGLLNLFLGFVYLFIRIEQLNINSRYQIIKQLYNQTAFRVLDVEEKGFLTYHQVDVLIKEIYENYMETMHPPSAEERYELVLELDSEGDGVIHRYDFEDIEEKCLGSALRALRAKKVRFHRFLSSANLISPLKTSALAPDIQPDSQTGSRRETSQSSISNLLTYLVHDHYHNRVANPALAQPLTEAEDRPPTVETEADDVLFDAEHVGDSYRYQKGSRNERLYSEASNYGRIQNQQLVDRLRAVEIMDRLAAKRANSTISNKNSCFARFSRFWRFKLSTIAMHIDSKRFDICFDVILAILAIACFASSDETSWNAFSVYLIFAAIESFSKLLVKGRFRFWKSWRNFSDGLITLVLIGIVIGQVVEDHERSFNDNFGLQSLVLVRLLLFPRNVLSFDSFTDFRTRHRKAFIYAFKSAGHIVFLLIVMIAMIYGFAALGQQIFGGSIIKTGQRGEDIADSIYGQSAYWPLNFNDMPSGIITLFCLLHVNNMHVTVAGFVAASTTWAEVFFAIWYSLGVLLLLNVLVAVFVNQFAGYLEVLAADQARQQEQLRLERERLSRAAESSMSRTLSTQNLLKASEVDHSATVAGDLISATKDNTARSSTRRGRENSESRPRASTLEELHSMKGGFDNSIFADKSYRASLMKMMKQVNRDTISRQNRPTLAATTDSLNSSTRSSRLLPDLRGSSSFSSSPYSVSDRYRRREDVVNAWNAEFRPSSGQNLSQSSQSERTPTRSSATLNPIFVAKDDLSVHGKLDSDLSITPEGDEAIVINVELKLQKDDGSLDEAPGETIQQAIHTIEQSIASNSQTYPRKSLFSAMKPKATPIRMSRLHVDHSKSTSLSAPILGERESSDAQLSASSALSYPTSESMKTSATDLDPAVRMGSFYYLMCSTFRSCRSLFASGEEGGGEDDRPSRFEKAAVFIQFARDGEGEHMIRDSRYAFHCYKLRHYYAKVFRVTGFVLMLLRLFERPLWVFSRSQWYDNDIYPRFGNPLLSPQLMCGLKFLVFVVLMLGLCLEIGYKAKSVSDFCLSLRESLLTFLSSLRKGPSLNHSPSSASLVMETEAAEDEQLSPEMTTASMTLRRFFRVFLWIHCLVMLLLLFIAASMNFSSPQLVTATSFGAVLYFLWFNRRTFQKLEVVVRILPKFLLIILVLSLLILLFAGFGPMIFHLENRSDDDYKVNSSNDDDSTIYFDNFSSSIWSVFVAITSSSWPDQIMPSYDSSREAAVYFVAFISLGAFGVLNLVIVLVFVEFQKSLQASYDRQKVFRDILLFKAFQVLDGEGEGRGWLQYEEVSLLCDEIYLNYSNFEKIGESQSMTRSLLIEILDLDGNRQISLQDFLFFLDVMRIKLTFYKKYSLLEHYRTYVARLHNPPRSKAANQTEQQPQRRGSIATQGVHMIFRYISYDTLRTIDRQFISNRRIDIIADGLGFFFFILNIAMNGIHALFDPTRLSILLMILTVVVYAVEMSLKILFRGWSDYSRSYRNRLDCIITVVLFLSILIDSSLELLYENDSLTFIMKIAYLFRVFLFPRNFRLFFPKDPDVIKVAKLFKRIFFKLYTLTMLFLCVGFAYANLGCFLFGGVIDKHSTNAHFLSSLYVENDFWSINFNDMISSLSTLFILLHVSDWDVITTGFTSSTTAFAKIYFAVWYVLGVLFLLNVLKSFFLGEFLALFIDPSQNLPDFNYDKRKKKRQSRRSSKMNEEEGSNKERKDYDKDHIEKHQKLKKEGNWISKRKATNESLRNRLIARLNQSLFASNRRGLEEDDDKDDEIDRSEDDADHKDQTKETIPKRNFSVSKLENHEKKDRDTDSFDYDEKPSFELPISRTVSQNPSANIAVPTYSNRFHDVLVEGYHPFRDGTAKDFEGKHANLSASFFHEIDEAAATNPHTDFPSQTADNPTGSYEGNSTVVVSSLGAKRLDSEREQQIKQRIRRISANLRPTEN